MHQTVQTALIHQHKKSAWSCKTWTLEIRVEYAVEQNSFWLSMLVSLLVERSWGWCVSCAFQHWFPVVFVSDRIWFLKHFREFFDLFWSIKLFIATKWRFNEEFNFSSLEYLVYQATKRLKYFQGTQRVNKHMVQTNRTIRQGTRDP